MDANDFQSHLCNEGQVGLYQIQIRNFPEISAIRGSRRFTIGRRRLPFPRRAQWPWFFAPYGAFLKILIFRFATR